MKKYLVILFSLLSCMASGQVQDMVLLPQAMHLGEEVNSICISLFSDYPSTESHFKYESGESAKITGNGNSQHLSVNGGVPDPIRATFLLAGDHSIDSRLKSFVNRKIVEFGGTDYNEFSYLSMQNQVWAYNVLDRFGYLTGEGDVVADFDQGIRKFSDEYMISNSTAGFPSKAEMERKAGEQISNEAYNELKSLYRDVKKYSRVKEIGYSINERHKEEGLSSSRTSANISDGSSVKLTYNGQYVKQVNIHYEEYPGEIRIIANNPVIKTNFTKFYIDNGVPFSAKIVPVNNHTGHFLIIYDNNGNARKFTLPNNSHTVIYVKKAVNEC